LQQKNEAVRVRKIGFCFDYSMTVGGVIVHSADIVLTADIVHTADITFRLGYKNVSQLMLYR